MALHKDFSWGIKHLLSFTPMTWGYSIENYIFRIIFSRGDFKFETVVENFDLK